MAYAQFPSEVIANILENLGPKDLKSCRLVDRQTCDEATRLLFRTLFFKVRNWVDRCDRLDLLRRSDLIKHSRHFVYETHFVKGPYFQLAFALSLLHGRSKTQPTSIDIKCRTADIRYLFSKDATVEHFLARAKTFKLIYDHDIREPELPSHWSPTIIPRYRTLSGSIPQVRELSLGFQKTYVYSESGSSDVQNFDRQMAMMTALLQGYYPNLRTLYLQYLVLDATKDDLVQFLERHSSTLIDLTLNNLCLKHPCDGFSFALRLFVMLHEALRLERMSLQDSIWTAGSSHIPGLLFIKTKIILRQNGKWYQDPRSHDPWSTLRARGTLRRGFEDYICHRSEFPILKLRPHMQRILRNGVHFDDRKRNFEDRTIRVEQSEGAKPLKIALEDDDTFHIAGSTELLFG
ncbi:hypothetical protein H2200_003958 [Cladophialophora chaetospira]|uniref:F-box domain-containing protein n=1 Tax=Cladophialophora chaetospira TaxID=386627 RepID=A0AA38XFU3_9EURO|nr:hypothetical protein H2200_003958 [Cladophialophora chaetospira]